MAIDFLKVELQKYLNLIYSDDNHLHEAIRYSLNNKGKKVRPLLLLLLLESIELSSSHYMPLAAALEMVHTYSLVHDDLPAIDNDNYRHNRLTVHRQFNEATAVLVGDSLLTDAFLEISKVTTLSADQKMKIVSLFATSLGSRGMVYGQSLDIEYENKAIDLETLKEIHLNKTAKLLTIPFKIIGIINDDEDNSLYEEIGTNLGIAFQIQDDILDVVSTFEVLGKSTNKDVAVNKGTYVKILGIERSKEELVNRYEIATIAIKKLNLKYDEDILNFIGYLIKREL